MSRSSRALQWAGAGRTARRHLILLLIAAAFLFPLAIMVSTALESPADVGQSIPKHLFWGNFSLALNSMPFLRYLLNTLILVVLNVAGTVLTCPLVAYALAKFPSRISRLVFFSILGTMMLPAQVTFIPLYLLWNRVGLVGTFAPLVIPQFFGTAFYIFLLRQFFAGVPDSLIEAARVDGASEIRTYFRVILPQAKAAVTSVAIFQFVATWTDFVLPLIYLTKSSDYTLSLGLYNFVGEHGVDWGPLMAACLMFTVPAVGLFMIAQRYFVRGIAVSGMR